MSRFRQLGAFPLVVLAAAALLLALGARRWTPPFAVDARTVVDERGAAIPCPERLTKVAVFMAIGAGEYILVTRRPGDIVTSPSSTNIMISQSSLMRRAFPDVAALRMPMSLVETGAVNLETLLIERPGVTVTWARLASEFERVGLPVIGLGPVSSIDRFVENTRVFAAIVDQPQRAQTLTATSRQRRVLIARQVAQAVSSPTRMAIVVATADGLWRAGSGFKELIQEAGGLNVGPPQASGAINAEELLRIAPDVVVITGGGGVDGSAPGRLMAIPALSALPAVRNRRVYDYPPGVSGYMSDLIELPIYMRWLAEILHPLDLPPQTRALAKVIYREELGVEPTDEELDDALAMPANTSSAFIERMSAR